MMITTILHVFFLLFFLDVDEDLERVVRLKQATPFPRAKELCEPRILCYVSKLYPATPFPRTKKIIRWIGKPSVLVRLRGGFTNRPNPTSHTYISLVQKLL